MLLVFPYLQAARSLSCSAASLRSLVLQTDSTSFVWQLVTVVSCLIMGKFCFEPGIVAFEPVLHLLQILVGVELQFAGQQ